jgi:hypothetical protein
MPHLVHRNRRPKAKTLSLLDVIGCGTLRRPRECDVPPGRCRAGTPAHVLCAVASASGQTAAKSRPTAPPVHRVVEWVHHPRSLLHGLRRSSPLHRAYRVNSPANATRYKQPAQKSHPPALPRKRTPRVAAPRYTDASIRREIDATRRKPESQSQPYSHGRIRCALRPSPGPGAECLLPGASCPHSCGSFREGLLCLLARDSRAAASFPPRLVVGEGDELVHRAHQWPTSGPGQETRGSEAILVARWRAGPHPRAVESANWP